MCPAMRPPCPEHTSAAYRGRETEAAGCAEEGQGILIVSGHGQRAEVKGAIISTSLETQGSSQRRPEATATRPVQTLSSWPDSSQTLGNSARGEAADFPCPEKSSRLPTAWSFFPVFVTCF